MSVTFTHLTSDPRQEKGEGKVKLPPLTSVLTVPNTLEDLVELMDKPEWQAKRKVVLGKTKDNKREYLELPMIVAAVVESMKLWQNAKIAASVRPKANKQKDRDNALAWAIENEKDELMKAILAGSEAKDEYLDSIVESMKLGE